LIAPGDLSPAEKETCEACRARGARTFLLVTGTFETDQASTALAS
jgi:hypothetical protein